MKFPSWGFMAYLWKSMIFQKYPNYECYCWDKIFSWDKMFTYCKGQCQVSRCGRWEHEVGSLHHIHQGPISACSLAKTEIFIFILNLI